MFLLKWENEVIFHIGTDSQIISRFFDSENEKQTSGSRVSAESVILPLKCFLHFAEVIKR